jgi:hypothetical protein
MTPFADYFGQFGLHTLVIAASILYFWGTIDWKKFNPTVRIRLLSILGLLVTAALAFLGGVWPSAFTLVAIIGIAAPFIFVVALFWPAPIWKRPKLRIYLNACVFASVLCWIDQLCWELRH